MSIQIGDYFDPTSLKKPISSSKMASTGEGKRSFQETVQNKTTEELHKFMAASIKTSGDASAMSGGETDTLMPMMQTMMDMLRMENDAKQGSYFETIKEQGEQTAGLVRASVTAGLVDKYVQIENGAVEKTDDTDTPSVQYDMSSKVQHARLIVTDEHGRVVSAKPFPIEKTGDGLKLTWDGKKEVLGEAGITSESAPAGRYNLSVLGKDVAGGDVPVPVYTSQKVTSVQLPLDGRTATVNAGGITIPMEQVRALAAAAA